MCNALEGWEVPLLLTGGVRNQQVEFYKGEEG